MVSKPSFENPLVEQRELLAGTAACELGARTIISVSGVDRLEWLHSMFSQALRGLKAGESAEALSLDPQGHVEQVLHIIETGERTLLVADADAAALMRWLDMRVFSKKVALADLTGLYGVVATLSHEGVPQAGELDGIKLVWQDPWPRLVSGGVRYAKGAPTPWKYSESLVPIDQLSDVFGDLKPAGTLALDALRIAAMRPSKQDVDEKSLPHEFDWLTTAVHLTKGCYRGQESVAKVHNLGHPPRRLIFMHLDGSEHEVPDAGAQIFVVGEDGGETGKPRGHVTAAAQHFEDGPIALGLVARGVPENAALEVQLASGSRLAATQVVVVPADAGNAGNIREKRKLLMGGGH